MIKMLASTVQPKYMSFTGYHVIQTGWRACQWYCEPGTQFPREYHRISCDTNWVAGCTGYNLIDANVARVAVHTVSKRLSQDIL